MSLEDTIVIPGKERISDNISFCLFDRSIICLIANANNIASFVFNSVSLFTHSISSIFSFDLVVSAVNILILC